MKTSLALQCLAPRHADRMVVRPVPLTDPRPDEIQVAVEAAAVNPIDVRRADGYGRRLLSLMKASEFPLVLGNDFFRDSCRSGNQGDRP